MRWGPYLWTGFAAIILSVQVLRLPLVGLADNNDFPKITGRLVLCPEDTPHYRRYLFVTRKWVVDSKCAWDSELPSTELWLARLALGISHAMGNAVFDIRFLGAVQALLLLAAMAGLFFWSGSWLLNLFALVLFTDVAYVSMLNSFYMDTASLLFLFTAVVSLLWAYRTRRPVLLGVYFVSVACLTASKVQHSWLALPALVPLFLLLPRRKIVSATLALLLLFLAGYMFRATTPDYSAQALWNSIFLKLLPQSGTRQRDLEALGLDRRFLQYANMNTYAFPSEQEAIHWRFEMSRETTFIKLIRYYATRPRLACERLVSAIRESLQTRPWYLGNFEQSAGLPPRAKSNSFALWSGLKSRFGERYPLMSFLVVLAASACILLAAGYCKGLHFAWLILAAAVGDAAIACFADGLDWARHLFIAQALMDVFLCFAVYAIVLLWRAHATRYARPAPQYKPHRVIARLP